MTTYRQRRRSLHRIVTVLILSAYHSVTLHSRALAEELQPLPLFTETEMEIEPEVTAFDVIRDEKLVATVLAKYGDGWLEIESPEDVIEELKVSPEGTSKVESALSGRIEGVRIVDGVGRFEADTDNFRIRIALDPAVLPEKVTEELLPEPTDRLAFLQRFGVAASGDYDNEKSAAFNFQSRLSKGRFWGKYDTTSLSEGQDQVDELAAFGLIGSVQAGTGLQRTPGQTFAQSVDMLGLSLKTSEDIIQNQESLRGSRFQIFVPSRSRVEFYRDSRLLSVEILDFGLQEADTQSWPSGSYEVTAVIREESGGTVTDQRFFTKSGLLALTSRPIYSFNAGVLRDQYSLLDTPVYQTGIRFRAADALELNSSVYGTDDIALASLGSIAIWQGLTFDTNISSSTKSELGLMANVSGEIYDFGWNVNWSRSFSNEAPPEVEILDDGDGDLDDDEEPTFIPEPNQLDLLSAKRRSLNGVLSKNFDNVIVKISGNTNRSSFQDKRYAVGPSLEWRIINSSDLALSFSLGAFRTDEGDKSEAYISLRKTFGKWSSQSQLSARRDPGHDDVRATSQLTYDARSNAGKGVRATLSNETGNSADDDSDVMTINGAALEYGGDYMNGGGFLRDRRSSENDGTAYGVNARSAVLITDEPRISIARPVNYEAVYIAEVESDSSNTTFEVLVNDQVYEEIEPGSRAVIGLSPFRTYRFAIRPSKSSDVVSYDNSVKTMTVFPGNIIRQVWSAEKVTIALGRVVDQHGEPIATERIRGAKGYVFTEEDGSFQAEITGKEEFAIRSPRTQCGLTLPDMPIGEFFTDYGDVLCNNTVQQALAEPPPEAVLPHTEESLPETAD